MSKLGVFITLASTALGMHDMGYSFDSVAFWCALSLAFGFATTQCVEEL